ncbi:hypothetical protein D0U04_07540 [Bacillus clarus]|uniref:Uncharacterized protein n=1 Tax=Bacillus clarus TaxID=2338372 RepID=A0ABX9KZ03_9BACI|nr:hypothetical protein [Bacillus clarus]RFT67618.1 hypothetical protein D0U04_07540 [Bacillus clarus]
MNVLTLFPMPYPGELVYSMFVRYPIRSGNRNTSQTAKDIFHTVYAIAAYDLPTHLERVANNIDNEQSCNE